MFSIFQYASSTSLPQTITPVVLHEDGLVIDADPAHLLAFSGVPGSRTAPRRFPEEDFGLGDEAGGNGSVGDGEGRGVGGCAWTQALAAGWRFMMRGASVPRWFACVCRRVGGRRGR